MHCGSSFSAQRRLVPRERILAAGLTSGFEIGLWWRSSRPCQCWIRFLVPPATPPAQWVSGRPSSPSARHLPHSSQSTSCPRSVHNRQPTHCGSCRRWRRGRGRKVRGVAVLRPWLGDSGGVICQPIRGLRPGPRRREVPSQDEKAERPVSRRDGLGVKAVP